MRLHEYVWGEGGGGNDKTNGKDELLSYGGRVSVFGFFVYNTIKSERRIFL